MIEAYIFCADVYCPDCIRSILIEQFSLPHDASLSTCDEMLSQVLISAGRDPERESSWDSNEFPKGPFSDGGGEADTPQHCAGCHCFLENPLTQDGYAYLIEALNDGSGDPDVKAQWRDFYAADFYKGRPVLEYLKSSDSLPPIGSAKAFFGGA